MIKFVEWMVTQVILKSFHQKMKTKFFVNATSQV